MKIEDVAIEFFKQCYVAYGYIPTQRKEYNGTNLESKFIDILHHFQWEDFDEYFSFLYCGYMQYGDDKLLLNDFFIDIVMNLSEKKSTYSNISSIHSIWIAKSEAKHLDEKYNTTLTEQYNLILNKEIK